MPPPSPARLGAHEVGLASWYGHPYHGRRTSNGEVYDMEKMTAAHLSLPFGTWVRVTNLQNQRQTDVRINDRGPFVKGRIIDLSKAAAREISLLGPGITKVRVEVIARPGETPPGMKPAAAPEEPVLTQALPQPAGTAVASAETSPVAEEPLPAAADAAPPAETAVPCFHEPYYTVQVGSFREKANAERQLNKVQQRHGDASLVEEMQNGAPMYRVVVGQESDFSRAQQLAAKMKRDGTDGFVARIEPPADCL